MMGHEKPITSVDEMAKYIADQLVCSELTPIRALIGVSVIADLNKIHQTTDFGRLLSEDLISQLQRKNMAVIDIRAQTFMLINPKGEFYSSRNINNLRKEYKIGYVLVGTYSVGDYSTSVNARIIDVSNGLVVATAHSSIPTQIINDLFYNSSQSVSELQLRGSSMAPSYQNVAQATPPPAIVSQVKQQSPENSKKL
ncbi:MAG: FlgO family outer membrane protein [Hydrogenobaculum sp.]